MMLTLRGDRGYFVRLPPTSSRSEITNLLTAPCFGLSSCSVRADVPLAPGSRRHSDQRRLKVVGDSRRTTSFLDTRAILVHSVHCLPPSTHLLLRPSTPRPPKTFKVCFLKFTPDASSVASSIENDQRRLGASTASTSLFFSNHLLNICFSHTLFPLECGKLFTSKPAR